MNILIVCNKSPFPPKEGGPIAMNAIITGLLDAGHSVKVIAINSNKYHVSPDEIPVNYREKTRIEFVDVDLSVKPCKALANLFSNRSYHVERFISAALENKISEVVQNDNFDIIQFETLYISPYIETIRKYSNAKIILRAHNIEHLIWERVALSCKQPVKRRYLWHLARTLKKYELNALHKFDGIAAITRKDAIYFRNCGTIAPVTDISFGINFDNYQEDNSATEFPSVFHIGAMNWIPNNEGIKWFLENIWGKINILFPDLTFYIAGREMPDWIQKKKYPNVEILGEVEDASAFMRSKAIMVVPLFSGSGIRIKIIEGMALGKTIITTRIGAEGINCTDNENVIIADNPIDFIAALKKCLENKELCCKIGSNARKLIEKEHNNQLIIRKLTHFYDQVIQS
ncbi:MAG: glycosyltransferase family 4 protein [Lentimicrobiaceae bacterium]|nr:glycosyltransferase family 4 protein [Lentimicrobiaceae bacterium]